MAQLNAADRAVLAKIQYGVMRKFMEERTQRTEVQVCTPVTHQRSGQAYTSSVEHSKGSSNKNLLSSESTSLQLPDTKPLLTDQQTAARGTQKKASVTSVSLQAQRALSGEDCLLLLGASSQRCAWGACTCACQHLPGAALAGAATCVHCDQAQSPRARCVLIAHAE